MKDVKISSVYIRPLVYVEELIYYDGPLLLLYKDNYSNPYLYFLVDSDAFCNRWLIINLNPPEILDIYLGGGISLLELIKGSSEIIVADIIENSRLLTEVCYSKYGTINFSDIPEDYLPQADSYYI